MNSLAPCSNWTGISYLIPNEMVIERYIARQSKNFRWKDLRIIRSCPHCKARTAPIKWIIMAFCVGFELSRVLRNTYPMFDCHDPRLRSELSIIGRKMDVKGPFGPAQKRFRGKKESVEKLCEGEAAA